MTSFNDKILIALKEKFLEGNPKAKFDSDMTSPKNIFYLAELNDNLFEPMLEIHQKEYKKGSGKELNQSMRALRSSSAMTFNLLGNDSIIFKKNPLVAEGKYSIEYEKQLVTLNTRGQPANLDAQLLYPEKGIAIFCEMKMTEWLLNSPGKLKNAYLKEENYLRPESFKAFNQALKSLIKTPTVCGTMNKSIYERYDAFQMVKHILGIYNAIRNNEYDEFNKIRLINCVWKIDCHEKLGEKASANYIKRHLKELDEFKDFKIKLQPIISLFTEIDIDFDIVSLFFDEFLNMLEKPDQQIAYLNRYFI